MRYISARQMIFDAYHEQRGSVMAYAQEIARMGTQVQTTQRNNYVTNCEWTGSGCVISAVENQPVHLAALTRYCFGPFTKGELAGYREIVEIALYQQMIHEGVKLPGQDKGKPTVQQLEALRYLCMAALYHHSEVTWPYSRPGLHSPNAVRKWFNEYLGAEIDVRFWTRKGRTTWGCLWGQALLIIDRWEQRVLQRVAVLIRMAA